MNGVSEGRDRPMIFRVNDCQIDIGAYEVRSNGQVVPVEPQVYDLLVLLIENRDRLMTKDEIVDRIWHGRTVSEAGSTAASSPRGKQSATTARPSGDSWLSRLERPERHDSV